MILVQIEGIAGDCKIEGFDEGKYPGNAYFTVESFGFGVEREFADSAKAGTTDLNLGVGELQECSISKSMDTASVYLAKKAISGSSCKTAHIKFVEAIIDSGNNRKNVVYLHVVLDTVFVKTWSMSGDGDDRPTEEVALWYNRIGLVYWPTADGKTFPKGHRLDWDQSKAKTWPDADKLLPKSVEILKA
jgi:type VI secretion system secreted protein Hcp